MVRGLDPTLFAALFLLSTFVAATVVGLAGFAFGLVASGIWLYILSPVQTATMILAFGFLVQSYAVWVQRNALDWSRIWPMVLGSAFGIPVGVAILTAANPAHLRMGVGALLVLYCLYGFARPAMKPLTAGGVPATSARASSTVCSAAPPGSPECSPRSGASCAAARATASARCSSRSVS